MVLFIENHPFFYIFEYHHHTIISIFIMTIRAEQFQVFTVPLTGKNLIEASAGTGKTYSIAILTLRLLLEEKRSITELLMVTFTNAAVAELESRIRLFIKESKNYIDNGKCNIEDIGTIVEQALKMHERAEIVKCIQNALLLIDEMQIKTIHSFCQQTLQEFAIETKQLFGAELRADLQDITEKYYNEFWRQNITTLPQALLAEIDIAKLRSKSLEILKQHFNGVHYATRNQYPSIQASYELLKNYDEWKQSLKQNKEALLKTINEAINTNKDTIVEKLKASKIKNEKIYSKALIERGSDGFWEELTSRVKDSWEKSHILKIMLPHWDEAALETLLCSNATSVIYDILIVYAIQQVSERVTQHQKKSNLLTYNDLIHQLYHALHGDTAPMLIKALQKKYKAVFVDEFQDTDKEQFEIFKAAFGTNTLLLLIGDPKQSIYAFRKADIQTYLNAKKFVDNNYTMDTNFRSATNFIESMNHFFQPHPLFDTFKFANEENAINYQTVKAPENNRKGKLVFEEKDYPGIQIRNKLHKNTIPQEVAKDIHHLINNTEFAILKDNKKRPIQYSDIAVLIRNNKEGAEVKVALDKLHIPNVVVDENKIFDAPTTLSVLQLMRAIHQRQLSPIRTALSSNLFGITLAQLELLQEDAIMLLFEALKETWAQSGISACLLQALETLGIKIHLLENNQIADLAVYHQLTEILHNLAFYQKYNEEELIIWLENGIKGQIPSEDSYLLRLESDEAAVKIVTIHKSKGLEFPIVFAPFLTLSDTLSNRRETFTYQDKNSKYWVVEKHNLKPQEEALINQQISQENRRLIYVAITRAAYQCFIYHSDQRKSDNALNDFIASIDQKYPNTIRLTSDELVPAPTVDAMVNVQRIRKIQTSNQLPSTFYNYRSWTALSYSKIAATHEAIRYERTANFADNYDAFVFQTLKSGANTGNIIHSLLEKIDFKNPTNWNDSIEKKAALLFRNPSKEMHALLFTLLENIMGATILFPNVQFTLAQIGRHQRLNELEFHFPLKDTRLEALQSFLQPLYNLNIYDAGNNLIEGMMQGFIDMVIEYDGKYYILDWKTNYLGYTVADYSPEKLSQAMSHSNYHLQYLIYTVALVKYLKSRIANFNYQQHVGGIIYCYIRGVRKDASYGIFTHIPEEETIKTMTDLLLHPDYA